MSPHALEPGTALRLMPGLCLLLAACSPALNWREARPPQAEELTVMLPCKPEHRAREVLLPRVSDQSVQMHLLACQADDVTWAISYVDTGTPAGRAVALAALRDALWTNTMASTPDQARRQDLRPAAIPGMTPHPDARVWWMQGQRPDGQGGHRPVELVAWHFSRGLKVFQATASAPTLRPDDPRLEAFEQGLTFPR